MQWTNAVRLIVSKFNIASEVGAMVQFGDNIKRFADVFRWKIKFQLSQQHDWFVDQNTHLCVHLG